MVTESTTGVGREGGPSNKNGVSCDTPLREEDQQLQLKAVQAEELLTAIKGMRDFLHVVEMDNFDSI